jgi:hypothetical protein
LARVLMVITDAGHEFVLLARDPQVCADHA